MEEAFRLEVTEGAEKQVYYKIATLNEACITEKARGKYSLYARHS